MAESFFLRISNNKEKKKEVDGSSEDCSFTAV